MTDKLCRAIKYTFTDKNLLTAALTHRSFAMNNNERLEFLGDSILSVVIAEALYHSYPSATEGELSRLRALFVKGETLAEIAKELNLGEYLILGQGEMKSGGFRRESILADCFEALIAAIFLDSSMTEAKTFILNRYHSRLTDKTLMERTKDPKTELQEWLQAKKHPLPIYELVETTGEQHNQEFVISCQVPSLKLMAMGRGSNRRKAEKEAASNLLRKVQ